MLKTFELKAKSLNCQLLSREHHGRDRFDTWLHPIGAIIHTSHRNEHIHALAISPASIQHLLMDDDVTMSITAMHSLLVDFKVGRMEVSLEGRDLATVLTFELRDHWYTDVDLDGNYISNGVQSGFFVAIAGEPRAEFLASEVASLVDVHPHMDLSPEGLTEWLSVHPQFISSAGDLTKMLFQIEMMSMAQGSLQEAIGDFATSLGMEVEGITVLDADDLPEEVLRMINQEDGFTSSMADLVEPVDPLAAVASSELPS